MRTSLYYVFDVHAHIGGKNSYVTQHDIIGHRHLSGRAF